MPRRLIVMVTTVALMIGCTEAGKDRAARDEAPPVRPSILLVTLDTTRADAVGPQAKGVETGSFNALAARGRRFSRAYATVPETLPSHSSMMTGLYPAGHGVHENGRTLKAEPLLLAERLQQAGYETAAFVSSFVLARRFGLARGFRTYDDVETAERPAQETTDRAIEYLRAAVRDLVASRPSTECLSDIGGIVRMRPLIAHASSKAVNEARRRVLHIEYAPSLRTLDGLSLAIA